MSKRLFEKLAPIWSKKLENDDFQCEWMNGEQLSISCTNTCVMGEIYNFKPNYALSHSPRYCGKCHTLSIELANLITLKLTSNEEYKVEKKRLIDKVEQHMKAKHKGIG